MFPEIRHSAKLPHESAAELKGTLQALAEMAGYGTNFAEVGVRMLFLQLVLSFLGVTVGRPEERDA